MELTDKRCPQCAEIINSQAVKCRYCQTDLGLYQRSNSGIPARRIMYLMGLAAFIVSGMDLATHHMEAHAKQKAICLTVISIVLMVAGIIVQVVQRKAGDVRSDRTFWIISIIVTVVLIFAGMVLIA